ncbi:retrovirus-related Pol polyprotein from transposon opus [Trichonephila clavipes]|nr:retrovirus-related Pol polyprotein from transposon opus [Trichonephila clavipes]
MDDVIISSPSFTQHVKHLKEVFRLLHEAGLTFNKDKCKFGCEELKYLGLIINKEGIKTDETKVQAIVEIKPPHKSKEVSKFLGMSQWYAKFIKNYADIFEPLYNLKRKLKRFIWSIVSQKAFDVVKAAITKALVLKFPDFKKPFELLTDASSIWVRAVLNQEQRPVVFASRTLSAAERNYTVTERECLAVVWALNKFRTYSGSLPIKVITDHAALTHLTTGKNLSNGMIRWALKLAEFNIEWEHRPRTQNTIADVLSRNPIESIIGEKVNCAIIRDLVLSSRDQLIEEQKTDTELGHIYRYLENPEDSSVNAAICENWSRDFRLVECLLFYAKYATSLGEMRVYTFPPKSLRNEIMREFHDKPLSGHFGRFKTYHKIRDVCYFPYMRRFIDQYVPTCRMCEINNYKNALPAGRLMPIVSNYPNEIVTLDLLGPYPVSRVRIYRHRKCDETEIGTGSSDNDSLRDESSGFDRVQRRSNDTRDGKRKGQKSGGPERKVQKGSEHRVPKRNLSSNDTNSDLPKYRKKSQREKTVAPTTSGCSLRPRIGKRKESQPTIERKTSSIQKRQRKER